VLEPDGPLEREDELELDEALEREDGEEDEELEEELEWPPMGKSPRSKVFGSRETRKSEDRAGPTSEARSRSGVLRAQRLYLTDTIVGRSPLRVFSRKLGAVVGRVTPPPVASRA